MASESRHIAERIGRPAAEVYDYAFDPANLPRWAPGLGSSVEKADGRWFVETSMGRVGFAFVPRNDLGVLDHNVTLPTGEVAHNPMRVIADGSGCEAVFTLRRRPAGAMTSSARTRPPWPPTSPGSSRCWKGARRGRTRGPCRGLNAPGPVA